MERLSYNWRNGSYNIMQNLKNWPSAERSQKCSEPMHQLLIMVTKSIDEELGKYTILLNQERQIQTRRVWDINVISCIWMNEKNDCYQRRSKTPCNPVTNEATCKWRWHESHEKQLQQENASVSIIVMMGTKAQRNMGDVLFTTSNATTKKEKKVQVRREKTQVHHVGKTD